MKSEGQHDTSTQIATLVRAPAPALGVALVPQIPMLRITVLLACMLMAGLAAFMSMGSYSPRETVSGYLIPARGVTKVQSARPGIVLEVLVTDRQEVKAGQPLVIVSGEQSMVGGAGLQTLGIEELRAQEAQLALQLQNVHAIAAHDMRRLQERRNGLANSRASLRAEESTVLKRAERESEMLKRAETLRQQGYLTDVDLSTAQQRSLDVGRQVEVLQREISSTDSTLRELEQEIAGAPLLLRQRQSEIETRLSELRREMSDLEADRSIAVVAAVDGQVTAIQVEAGKSITTAQPLMMLVPAGGTLVAHLMVPSHAIGFVKVGQEVRVRYSAFPYERYGIYRAEIREVSATTLGPADWAIGLPAQNEPAYRVTAILDRQAVTTDQGATHLQAGMSLAADIMLEKRSVASWLFGPIASFRQRL